MTEGEDFDALVDQAMRAPLAGWRFPFLDERFRKDALIWDYSARARGLMGVADWVLDHGTGGGEVVAGLCESMQQHRLHKPESRPSQSRSLPTAA